MSFKGNSFDLYVVSMKTKIGLYSNVNLVDNGFETAAMRRLQRALLGGSIGRGTTGHYFAENNIRVEEGELWSSISPELLETLLFRVK